MGMFDTIYGKVRCPRCGKLLEFEHQTKHYDCLLNNWSFGDYISKGNDRGSYLLKDIKCNRCDYNFDVYMILVKGQIVKFVNNEDLKNEDIESLQNIEEGLSHIIEYQEQCRLGLGQAKEITNMIEHPKLVGDTIVVLNQNWTILEIYKERLMKKNDFDELFFQNGFVYKVTNNLENRLIRVSHNRFLEKDKGQYEVFYDNGFKIEYDLDYPNDFVIQTGCIIEKL